MKTRNVVLGLPLLLAALLLMAAAADLSAQPCSRTVTANVVALDQAFYNNRLGALQAGGMIFALAEDVVPNSSSPIGPGAVMLRPDKRPRPIVLRMNVGDCMEVSFKNLLAPAPEQFPLATNFPAVVPTSPFGPGKINMAPDTSGSIFSQPPTRYAGVHVMGMQLATASGNPSGILSDGSWVGANTTSLVPPNGTAKYKFYASAEGGYLLYSTGADVGQRGEATPGAQLSQGLFGAVIVEPPQAEWYRSQVTRDDLTQATYRADTLPANMKLDPACAAGANPAQPCRLVTTTGQTSTTTMVLVDKTATGNPLLYTLDHHPLINYAATYTSGPRSGRPILKMTDGDHLLATDLTAVITGPNAGRFPYTENGPDFRANPALPDRRQPFREFAIHYHDDLAVTQAFTQFTSPSDLQRVLQAGQDMFAINYGIAGIGPEVLANRLKVGPMYNCATCKFEEFFLSSWTVGDPAMVVDFPANAVSGASSAPTLQIAGDIVNNKAVWTLNGTALANNSTVSVQPGQQIQFSVKAGTHGLTFFDQAQAQQLFNIQQTIPFITPSVTKPSVVPGTWGTPGEGAGTALATLTARADSPPSGSQIKIECTIHQANMALTLKIVFPVKDGPKATKAFYPDDPSNVYHSYMSDHTKFRIIHAGMNLTHVHHQHAHQWLHTPNSDNSHYRDSQMISPGASYTLDYVYNGSGNLNQTVGDSIFHCHFYPHFAEGMWSLWRVHDTFEPGTQLVATSDPTWPAIANVPWNRALPDGEIASGTPIPGLVPLPTLPMAPLPARVQLEPAKGPDPADTNTYGFQTKVNDDDLKAGLNPGYPFFVPGVAGQRAPHPPLDFAAEDVSGTKVELNGGLPRHIVFAELGKPCGTDPSNQTNCAYEKHNRWDFSKDNFQLLAGQLPEEGTAVEKVAMAAHAQRTHPTFTPEGTAGNFILNGLPAVSGAPFANPGITLQGNPVNNVRRYKAANIQTDVVINKKGWHFPQQRMIALWGDVKDILHGNKRPEPFFFRTNSDEVVEYWHANLVPNYYDLDDFQVRTPTDILGQHIHLVKFDVTASDGAANGYNYEDGTFSPEEVREVIGAINQNKGLWSGGAQTMLTPKIIPELGAGPDINGPCPPPPADQSKCEWLGAQATVQRWFADPLLNNQGEDRTITTVFTHDHYGPSTHQQAGLYAGLLVEPQGSTWLDASGTQMGSRSDGGPTSWEAIIKTANPKDSYREFALEFQDMQLAYTSQSLSQQVPYKRYASAAVDPITDPDPAKRPTLWGWADPAKAVQPVPPPDPTPSAPWPTLVSDRIGIGSESLNYRNEPISLRVAKPPTGTPPAPNAMNLSHVFRSIPRNDSAMSVQPAAGTPIKPGDPNSFKFAQPYTGAQATDPYTPLLRAYPGDKIQIRTLAGAHLIPHFFTVHGVNWKFEQAFTNSGFRSAQGVGLSEHYEMLFDLPKTAGSESQQDYLYVANSADIGLDHGMWGLMRAYKTTQPGLAALPNNPVAPTPAVPVCAPVNRTFRVTATTSRKALGGPLIYNGRSKGGVGGTTNLMDWNALMYVNTDDLDNNGVLKPDVPHEPLVLRAAAGDCIEVDLKNDLPPDSEPLLSETMSPPFVYTLPSYVPSGPTPDVQKLKIKQLGALLNSAASNGQFYTPEFADAVNKNAFGFLLARLNPQLCGATPVEGCLVPRSFGGNSWQLTQTHLKPGDNSVVFFIRQASDTQMDVSVGITLTTSHDAGLHPQQLAYHVADSDGMNAGLNPDVAVPPGGTRKYLWYAGRIEPNGNHVPVEYGSISLIPSDARLQHPSGMQASLIVEPPGATWKTDVNSRSSATVTASAAAGGRKFREFVALYQDDVPTLTEGTALVGASGPSGPQWVLNGKGLANNAHIPIVPGQVITLMVASGTHGLAFLDWATAQQVFSVQWKVPAAANNVGPGSFGTTGQPAGTMLAVLTVKGNIPPTVTSVKFECSVHRAAMAGVFDLPVPPTTMTLVGDFATANQWVLNGTALPNNSVIPISPGQTITVSTQAGAGQHTHGITFFSQTDALKFFDIVQTIPFVTPSIASVPGSWGTPGQPPGTQLAVLKVKSTAPANTPLKFECTIHQANMAGTFQFGAPPVAPIDPGNNAINYRTEPLNYRYLQSNFLSNGSKTAPLGIAAALSNQLVADDPRTPVFVAPAGTDVRMRMLHPGGARELPFTLHGNVWQEEPYAHGSVEIGDNPLSQSSGSRDMFGPNISFEMLLGKGGGPAEVRGDYLFRTLNTVDFSEGLWGVLRVVDPNKDAIFLTRFEPQGTQVVLTGVNTVNPDTGQMADHVEVTFGPTSVVVSAPVDKMTGRWQAVTNGAPTTVTVTSGLGGRASSQQYIKPLNPAGPIVSPLIQIKPDQLDRFRPVDSFVKQ
jgi:hypothetical protein